MRIKLLHLLLGAGAAVGAYTVLHKPVRFIGDKAKVGDDVHVPLTSLPGPVPGLPVGAGLVNVRVSSVSDETVGGLVTAYIVHELPAPQIMTLPQPVGPIQVNRAAITSVVRGGREVS